MIVSLLYCLIEILHICVGYWLYLDLHSFICLVLSIIYWCMSIHFHCWIIILIRLCSCCWACFQSPTFSKKVQFWALFKRVLFHSILNLSRVALHLVINHIEVLFSCKTAVEMDRLGKVWWRIDLLEFCIFCYLPLLIDLLSNIFWNIFVRMDLRLHLNSREFLNGLYACIIIDWRYKNFSRVPYKRNLMNLTAQLEKRLIWIIVVTIVWSSD